MDIMRCQTPINEYLVSSKCGQFHYLVRIADSVPGRWTCGALNLPKFRCTLSSIQSVRVGCPFTHKEAAVGTSVRLSRLFAHDVIFILAILVIVW